MNVKKVIIGVLVFPLGIYWLLRHMGLQNKWAAVGISAIVTIAAILLVPTDDKKPSASATPPAATTTQEDTTPAETTTEQVTTAEQVTTTEVVEEEPKANVYIVASKSFCTATGIDDAYTGDGHVEFFYTFKNSGGADGTINVTPVRHYDDGDTNQSPLDMAEISVSAHSTYKAHTEAFTYKAHEHEIEGCGVKIDGDEIAIRLTHL